MCHWRYWVVLLGRLRHTCILPTSCLVAGITRLDGITTTHSMLDTRRWTASNRYVLLPAAGPVTDDTFEAEVLKSPVPVLIDFWAPWCGPCRMIAPLIDEIATEYKGKIKCVSSRLDRKCHGRRCSKSSARHSPDGCINRPQQPGRGQVPSMSSAAAMH